MSDTRQPKEIFLQELVAAPMDIRGYGSVKEKAVGEVKVSVQDLLSQIDRNNTPAKLVA